MMQPVSRTVSVPANQLEPFEPTGLGVFEAQMRDLLQSFRGQRQTEILASLDRARVGLTGEQSRDAAAFEVCVLVLADFIRSGYYPVLSNGRCYLAPTWAGAADGADLRRRAMQATYQRLRERQTAESTHVTRFLSTAGSIIRSSSYDAASVLRLTSLDLCEPILVAADTPGRRAVWNAVRATWSMSPDRSAPGREVSLFAADSRYPDTPIGIVQFRNVVPEIKPRDEWIGLTISTSDAGYVKALRKLDNPIAGIRATRKTLQHLLLSIDTSGIAEALLTASEASLRDLAKTHRALYHQRKGGERDGDIHPAAEHMAIYKRAETAAELLRGIGGFDEVLSDPLPLDAILREPMRSRCEAGLRKIWHYHMGFVAIEVSICGAAPPFGPLRAGKLMASLSASDEALNAWGRNRPLGQIAAMVYRQSVRDLVPNPGPLALFTSGLYPGHSAQYNRVQAGPYRWTKYGDSSGYGILHISAATSDAMARFNQSAIGYQHVTRRFGEGASARFRDIGAALGRLNLPDLRKHNVQRPLYVLPLTPNVTGALCGWGEPTNVLPASVKDLWNQWKQRWVDPRRDELIDACAAQPDLAGTLQAQVERVTGRDRQPALRF